MTITTEISLFPKPPEGLMSTENGLIRITAWGDDPPHPWPELMATTTFSKIRSPKMVPVLLKFLLPLVPVFISRAERDYGAKNGEKKKAAVVNALATYVKHLRDDTGKIPDSANALDVDAIVETVFQVMKATGVLVEEGDPTALGDTPRQVVFRGVLEPAAAGEDPVPAPRKP